ncbi:MAG: YihY/virulence factor BrkB family protein, partial [Verrucomicrobia bacterium]|nr:YihY/virulence factor BrkB family protein [Verrucomicrobiota bacterium]
KFSVIYVSRVVTYSKIYGALGMVPVFLVGLYFSWLIVLFGAQVAYALQNWRAYAQEKQAELVTQRGRELIALRVMTEVAQRFQQGSKPPTGSEIAGALGLPSRLIGQVLQLLLSNRLLVEVAGLEVAYAPGRPLEQVTSRDVLEALRSGPGGELPMQEGPAQGPVREELARIRQAEQRAGATTLRELIDRSQTPVQAEPGER